MTEPLLSRRGELSRLRRVAEGALSRFALGEAHLKVLVDDGLRPTHMAAVGALLGQLQKHATRWMPPAGFVPPHVDAIKGAARRASASRPPQPGEDRRHPTTSDL